MCWSIREALCLAMALGIATAAYGDTAFRGPNDGTFGLHADGAKEIRDLGGSPPSDGKQADLHDETDGVELAQVCAAEMLRIRLDYTWKHFDSAARHRMWLLNYFLIGAGILAGTYRFALKEKTYGFAMCICAFGLVVSFAFFLMDIRMNTYIVRSLDMLATLEREELFDDDWGRDHPKPGGEIGLARAEPDMGAAAAAKPRPTFWDWAGYRLWLLGRWLLRLTVWVRFIELVATAGFLVGGVCAFRRRQGCTSRTPNAAKPAEAPTD